MVDMDIWQPDVFQQVLHYVLDARYLRIRGMDVQFSICGLPTVGATQAVAALDAAAKYCPKCLALHERNQTTI